MGKKKVNPRRIPLAKKDIDRDKLISAAMKHDMEHAWHLIATALLELDLISPADIGPLCDEVNDFSKTAKTDKVKLSHAEDVMNRKRPKLLNISRVNSPPELEKFKRNVEKVALHTSLAVICLGLEKRFDEETLKRVFLSADLTEAEVDSGRLTWGDLERQLLNKMVKIEIDDEA